MNAGLVWGDDVIVKSLWANKSKVVVTHLPGFVKFIPEVSPDIFSQSGVLIMKRFPAYIEKISGTRIIHSLMCFFPIFQVSMNLFSPA